MVPSNSSISIRSTAATPVPPSDEQGSGAQGQGFEDIGAAAPNPVQVDLDRSIDRFHDLRQP